MMPDLDNPLARLLALAKPYHRETYHGEPWPVPVLWSDLIWAITQMRDSDESAQFWRDQAFYWARQYMRKP